MISRLVASLADAALLLPASGLLLVFLSLTGRIRMAATWAVCLGLAGIGTIGAKLAFHACGHAFDADVTSPSGHASFAVFFYGSLALLIGAGRPRALRLGLLAVYVLLVVGVSISRVRTGAHTPKEVGLGLGIGALALGLFSLAHRRAGWEALPWRPLAAGFAAAVALLGGLHFSLEHRIAGVARRAAAALDICAPPARAATSSLPFEQPGDLR